MAAAYAPINPAHSPTIMTEPSFPRAHEGNYRGPDAYASGSSTNPLGSGLPATLVLNTPHIRSSPAIPDEANYDSYLPTPQSAIPLSQQQPSPALGQPQHPFLQKHTSDYSYTHSNSPSAHSNPSPNQLWHPQPGAGPSTYRRTPNIASPLSVNGSEHRSSSIPLEHPSPAKPRAKGRLTAMGEQVMMDGMERMVVDEGDGRIGVEEPCECLIFSRNPG